MAIPFLGLAQLIAPLLDKLIPDKEAAAKAKLELMAMEQSHELETIKVQLSAIITEAQSADPWTSRARPTFMYVMYAFILCHGLFMPLLAAFFDIPMDEIYTSMKHGLEAIPEGMWWTFATGYLGYVAARQYGKVKGVDQ